MHTQQQPPHTPQAHPTIHTSQRVNVGSHTKPQPLPSPQHREHACQSPSTHPHQHSTFRTPSSYPTPLIARRALCGGWRAPKRGKEKSYQLIIQKQERPTWHGASDTSPNLLHVCGSVGPPVSAAYPCHIVRVSKKK